MCIPNAEAGSVFSMFVNAQRSIMQLFSMFGCLIILKIHINIRLRTYIWKLWLLYAKKSNRISYFIQLILSWKGIPKPIEYHFIMQLFSMFGCLIILKIHINIRLRTYIWKLWLLYAKKSNRISYFIQLILSWKGIPILMEYNCILTPKTEITDYMTWHQCKRLVRKLNMYVLRLVVLFTHIIAAKLNLWPMT